MRLPPKKIVANRNTRAGVEEKCVPGAGESANFNRNVADVCFFVLEIGSSS